MATSVSNAIGHIDAFIASRCGGVYRRAYVGIAADPRVRLFNEHNVRPEVDAYAWYGCSSDTEARRVESYFLALGCEGGPGGGDRESRFVYGYRMEAHTDP